MGFKGTIGQGDPFQADFAAFQTFILKRVEKVGRIGGKSDLAPRWS